MSNPIAGGGQPSGHNPGLAVAAQAAAAQAAQGGVVVGAPVQQVNRGDFVPGMGGIIPGQGHMPGGASSYANFLPSQQRTRGVPAPLDRPWMKELRAQAEQWFSGYLQAARGRPLQPTEEIPALLLLTIALYQTREPARNRCLNSMKALTFPISTSNPVQVKWEHQPFTSVPYAVQHFPIGPAIQILEQCKNNIFDDMTTLWDAQNNKQRMRLLQPSERTVVSFHIWRDPTPQESAAMNNDYGINPGTMVQMADPQSGDLLLSFAPQETLAAQQAGEYAGHSTQAVGTAPGTVQAPHPGQAGSAHPTTDPAAPPAAVAAPAAAAAPAVVLGGQAAVQPPIPGGPPPQSAGA